MVMNKKSIVLFLFALMVSMVSVAQSRRDIRINEVMVENNTNYEDGYGRKSAWIELYNSAHAGVEISSMFITDDKENPKKYPVPRGDAETHIHHLQHILFWADNNPSNGTFHLNFDLKPGQDNWIGVYDADGSTLIDSITIPASLQADHTYARVEDGKGTGVEAWEVRDGSAEKYITPSGNNVIVDGNKKIELFEEHDPHGFVMALLAMSVVFSALLILCLSFKFVGKISEMIAKRNKLMAHGVEDPDREELKAQKGDSGEEIAAIAMALYEHINAHDDESTILTINKVKRSYSPWSSKIYSLRQNPKN